MKELGHNNSKSILTLISRGNQCHYFEPHAQTLPQMNGPDSKVYRVPHAF